MLAARLEEAKNPRDDDDEEDEEAKAEASKYNLYLVQKVNLLFLLCREEGLPSQDERTLQGRV